MTQSSSLISGVAKRYAGSLYELAADAGVVEAVESGLGQIETLIGEHCAGGGICVIASHQPINLPDARRISLGEYQP